MRTMQLLEGLEFHERNANAQPMFVDKNGRVFRFLLKPGESIKEHNTHKSPFYIVVLKGTGIFAGKDGKEQSLGPNSLLILDPGESHHIRAEKESLVFVGFLHGAPSNKTERTGGMLGKKSSAK